MENKTQLEILGMKVETWKSSRDDYPVNESPKKNNELTMRRGKWRRYKTAAQLRADFSSASMEQETIKQHLQDAEGK